ncbi:sensor histidine kinase [Terriglobus aquaticus]|uniref:histidine kinase n=1 Tax=Terriglobus aquaticus TaxID=940139 RepID=A0ABW9KMQ7_9BACT|nr:ATP-binding protein [Terriglobus aquaticus]
MGSAELDLAPETVVSDSLPSFTPVDRDEVIARLRHVRGLEEVSDESLGWLADHGEQRVCQDNDLMFSTGEPAHEMFILLDGEIHVRRLPTGPVSYFVGKAGQMTGKLPFSRMKTYGGDGYAVGRVWGLSFDETLFPEMLQAVPVMAQLSVSLLLDRVREVTRIEQQSEKLTALGKLAANLSHELNNPASAARSAANNLWTELRTYGDTKYKLGAMHFSAEAKQKYMQWTQTIRPLLGANDHPLLSDLMLTGDREDAISKWMQDHGVEEPWRFAPALAETQIELHHLDALADALSVEALPIALASFSAGLKAERMTDTIMDATRRIFELITAIKDYSYMDQAPIQEIDVPQALDNTLAMLGSRLGSVEVVREYASDTPVINAYGGELNQVWTALIENALDSMDQCESDPHILRLKTCANGSNLVVEVWDNGPGIDPEIRSRIFEPFFTTKPVGAGLGLGLDAANRIVTKHRGVITVDSKPGETCFQVRLPIEQTGAY